MYGHMGCCWASMFITQPRWNKGPSTASSLVLHLTLQGLRTVGAGQSRQTPTARDRTGAVLITRGHSLGKGLPRSASSLSLKLLKS